MSWIDELAQNYLKGLAVEKYGPDWQAKLEHEQAATRAANAQTAHTMQETAASKALLPEQVNRERALTGQATAGARSSNAQADKAIADLAEIKAQRAELDNAEAAGQIPSTNAEVNRYILAKREADAKQRLMQSQGAEATAHAGLFKAQTDALNQPIDQSTIDTLAGDVHSGNAKIGEAMSQLTGPTAPRAKTAFSEALVKAGGLPVRLNPGGQKQLAEIDPIIGQIKDLQRVLEEPDDTGVAYKDRNTPFGTGMGRLKYAMGVNPSDHEGDIASQIANLELVKITSAMPYATKSRNFQYIQQIQQHLPNAWRDSGSLVYNKLGTALTNLGRIRQSILDNERLGGAIGARPAPGGAATSGTPLDDTLNNLFGKVPQ